MQEKVRKAVNIISEILEWAVALIVLIAIVAALVSLKDSFLLFWGARASSGAFMEFLGKSMNIVIGIEFLKMLCRPEADTVLEVVMFVIARHMIIVETSAAENLLTIVGIAVIILLKRYIGMSGGRRLFGKLRKQAGGEENKEEPSPEEK